jgi:hypothetical protein
MTDISAFPTISHVVDQGHQNGRAYKAGAVIKAGMVVAFARTGVTDTVHPHVKGTTGSIAGVAAYDIASGSWGMIYGDGAVVYIANADDTTGIDAGAPVEGNDNAVGGTVTAAAWAATVEGELYLDVLGFAVEDIAGNATGRVQIKIDISNRTQG